MPIHNLAPNKLLEELEDTENSDSRSFAENKIIAIDRQIQAANEATTKSLITGEDLLAMRVDNIPTLIGNWLLQTGLACLAGSSDTGKSALLRQLVIAIVSGQDKFLGWDVHARHNRALVVSSEDDQQAIAFLLRRQAADIEPHDLRDLHFLFDTADLLTTVDQRLTDNPVDLVVVDCFADAFGSDLKDTNRIRNYLHPWYLLAQKHKCLMFFLHHTGKRTEHLEPSKNNLLAGQGFEGKMRLVIELRADQSNPNYRHLCIVKGNYVGKEMKHESYLLEFNEHNFLFRNTGERIAFDALVKSNEGDRKIKYEQAAELKRQGYTLDQIAPLIGFSKKGKGNVSKLLNEFDNVAQMLPGNK